MFDLYTTITDCIIKELETGEIPWQKPWADTGRLAISHGTGKPYSLLNQLLLGKRPGEYIPSAGARSFCLFFPICSTIFRISSMSSRFRSG